MPAKSPCRVLGVPEGAAADEIKNAYRTMALKWHPDRHHNSNDKDTAARWFLEVTDAYRTLVRQGRVQSANGNNKHREPPQREPPRRSGPVRREPPHREQQQRRPPLPPMNHRNSSESSVSVESFVHMRGSGSAESLTTPASSKRGSLPPARNSGARKPEDAMPVQQRTAQSNIFNYQPPHRGPIKSSARYSPPAAYATLPPAPPAPLQPMLRPQTAQAPQSSRIPPVASNRPSARSAPPGLGPNANLLPPVHPLPPANVPNARPSGNNYTSTLGSKIPRHVPQPPPPPPPVRPLQHPNVPNLPRTLQPHNTNNKNAMRSLPNPPHPQPKFPPQNPRNPNTAHNPPNPGSSRVPPRPNNHPRNQMAPYDIPLHSVGPGPDGEWVYSMALSLEDIFAGKHFRFGITRAYLSSKAKLKHVVIEIDVPAGCRSGTRILCRNVGHERTPGVYQDIAFLIEELPHDRFVRVVDDLVMDVRLPWADSLRRQGGHVPFTGIDGRPLSIVIHYQVDKCLKGRSVIKGGGMPIREHGQVVGRGKLLVHWEILPPQARMLHFVRRLWGGK